MLNLFIKSFVNPFVDAALTFFLTFNSFLVGTYFSLSISNLLHKILN